MSELSQAVSINPYFKVHEGKLNAFKELMTRFVARTANEKTCYYYDFTVCGNIVFCREAYAGAEGLLAHLENVGACIEEALTLSELIRVEVHGPSEEIAKLREPLADLGPDFFEHAAGIA
ncbi:MAG: putative quinol monooxygenase [Verrucomicrobiaceae bacterium]